jgi:hypothetical protein
VQKVNGITTAHIASNDAPLSTICKTYRCKLINFSELTKSGKGSSGRFKPKFTDQVTEAHWENVAADMARQPHHFFVAFRRPNFGRKGGYPDALVFSKNFITVTLPGVMHWLKCIGKRILRCLLRRGWDNTVTTGTGSTAKVERPGVVGFLKVCPRLPAAPCCTCRLP